MAKGMRRKLCVLAAAGVFSVIVTAGSASKVYAQNWDNADVRPQNVGVINVPYDEFYMAEPGCARECRWIEKGEVGQAGQSNNFVERNRDRTSIYLIRDDGALIQFDFSRRQVLYIPRDNYKEPEIIVNITKVKERVRRDARADDDGVSRNNRNVTAIDVVSRDGATRQFRLVERGRDGRHKWIEKGQGEYAWQGNEFVEEARTENTINLFDRSRGENGMKFQVDLAGRQVLFIPSDRDRRPEKIYEIIRVSDRID
jgi:hypothetical protein